MACVEKLRTDYSPFPYLIEEIGLDFELGTETTTVISTLRVRPVDSSNCPELLLDGCPELQLLSVFLDGRVLPPSGYAVTPHTLIVLQPPARPFVLGFTVHACCPSVR